MKGNYILRFMLQLSDFHYELPSSRIANAPISPRDASKLLIVKRSEQSFTDAHFSDLLQVLRPGDVLVRNDSKVIKARLFGYKEQTGGSVEILLNKPISILNDQVIYECIVKPGLRIGQCIRFGATELKSTCVGFGSDGYTRHLSFNCTHIQLLEFLEEIGTVPLPPYMHRTASESNSFADDYQTNYALVPGSVAAPTAGLHFTPELDAELIKKGVEIISLTLHVGLGTFLPVKTAVVTEHTMHAENYSFSERNAARILKAKQEGRRVIAVGTTTTRVLESAAYISDDNTLSFHTTQSGSTDIFIYPPYKFKVIDGLITNFHLPESTLLMLISAFASTPQTTQSFTRFTDSLLGKAYQHAIDNQYRFFSFGDALLLI